MVLDQAEADALLALEKRRVNNRVSAFPLLGESLALELRSVAGDERFILDIQRKGRIKLTKITFQGRARHEVILARLDIDGPPHRNPDDTLVPCPHLHVYREGYDDRWAVPAPPEHFHNFVDLFVACSDFMAYFNVTVPPILQQAAL
jgi:hypothetical protein